MLKKQQELCILLWLICLQASAVAEGQDKGSKHTFKFTNVAHNKMDVEGKIHEFDAYTEVIYTWQRIGRERVVSFDSTMSRISVDGKVTKDSFMSRKRLSVFRNGNKDETSYEDAPANLQKLMDERFGSPLCKIQVDESGRELKRTIVAGPNLKDLVENGLLANSLLFHPPYLRDEKQWHADAEITIGYGGFARGKLNYSRKPEKKDGEGIIVSGTLSADSYKSEGGFRTLKNIRYVVHGEQTFDLGKNEWKSGKLGIDSFYDLEEEEKIVGSAKGTIKIVFEMLPTKEDK